MLKSLGRCTQYKHLSGFKRCLLSCIVVGKYCDASQYTLSLDIAVLSAKYMPNANSFLRTRTSKELLLSKPEAYTTRHSMSRHTRMKISVQKCFKAEHVRNRTANVQKRLKNVYCAHPTFCNTCGKIATCRQCNQCSCDKSDRFAK